MTNFSIRRARQLAVSPCARLATATLVMVIGIGHQALAQDAGGDTLGITAIVASGYFVIQALASVFLGVLFLTLMAGHHKMAALAVGIIGALGVYKLPAIISALSGTFSI